MAKYWQESFHELSAALDRLQEALSEPRTNVLALDGTIQRFEFSIELAWKTMQKLLRVFEDLDAPTPRRVMQEAYRIGWIDDEKIWIDMLKDRNLASHTYKEALAEEIYQRIGGYYSTLRSLHTLLTEYLTEHQKNN